MSDLKLQAKGSLLAGRRTRKGLGLLEQRQVQDATRLQALRTAVKVGLDDIQAGRFKAFDDKDPLRKHFQLLTSKVIAVG